MSYAYKDTLIPSIQYFTTWGSNDANYWGNSTGVPNSSGIKAELAFVPFGKTNSFSRFYNVRLALQCTVYNKFNGASAGASGNNTLLLLLQLDGAAW